MGKILFFVAYFGKLPWYFPLFYQSCIDNEDTEFLFIGDNFNNLIESENIKKINYSLEDFNSLASYKLGMKVHIKYGYKICDFRPSFGVIFEDFIKNYEFWGICDIDVILGNIRGFLSQDILNNYDFISTTPEYPSGYMSIYRNIPLINNLYQQSSYLRQIFTEDKNFMFDECGGCYTEVIAGTNILETISETDSIHHLLERNKHNIRCLFEYYSIGGVPGNIKYNKGILSYKDEFEILIYHLSDYKKNLFTDKNIKNEIFDSFIIHQYSIVPNTFKLRVIGRINDFYVQIKFKLLHFFDKIMMAGRKNIPKDLNNGTYNYMGQKFEIVNGKKHTTFQLAFLRGRILKSFFFQNFYYLKEANLYFFQNNDGMEVLKNDGTPLFYQKGM
ncbi:DUF6625 family protein [Chryseobacterium sp. LAM-KRS1]|uniref:DUF6625 family protein n=1 Tax=Chryseobacterium sp. LAM-KRS1 TaxID=2715754 RepID=UPI0015549350|nr:DUF6625 family protein [Chryseobacterium sp. LAM-KRS1]